MDDAVDAGLAVGPRHLVVPDRDPRVLVGDPSGSTRPWAAGDRRLVFHGGIVARGGRSCRTRPASTVDSCDDDARRRGSRPSRQRAASRGRDRPWDVRIPVRDGVELSANLWLPRPAAGDVRPLPGDPRDDPVRQGQLAPQRGHRAAGTYLAARGYALCRVDVRGHRIVGRGRARRVHRGRDAATAYDAVEWLAAQPWCDGRGRDVGHQLRRLHVDPGRQAAAAAPARDRPDPGDRRPLPDRRPLHRRLRHGQRAVASTPSARSG